MKRARCSKSPNIWAAYGNNLYMVFRAAITSGAVKSLTTFSLG